ARCAGDAARPVVRAIADEDESARHDPQEGTEIGNNHRREAAVFHEELGVNRDPSRLLSRRSRLTGSGRQEPVSRRIRWSGENDEAAPQTAMTALSCEAARRCQLLVAHGRPLPVVRGIDLRRQQWSAYLSFAANRLIDLTGGCRQRRM